jgi:hypothetical protein
MLGSNNNSERRNAFAALERTMQSKGVNWSDIGAAIERDAERDEGRYTESELLELAQAARAEGVKAGIELGLARASTNAGNGGLALPKPAEMAEYCHQRAGQLKDDKQRDFISDMHRLTLSRSPLSRPRLGYLISIYVQIGGRI